MIGFKVRGVEEIQAFLKTVPHGSKKAIIEAFEYWYIGRPDKALRHYEPYKYVKPFRSYSSDPEKAARQRAWIFAHLDIIGQNNRTGKTADSWKSTPLGKGYNIRIENTSEGAKHIWGDDTQTRHQKAVGHRKPSSKISSNLASALRHARKAVREFLNRKR